MPGLHPNERKWSRIFAAIAGPLFFAGVAVGYYVLPKGIAVLIGFTPDDVTNLVEFSAVLLLHQPDAAGLRHRLRDPAVRGHAEPRRRGLGQGQLGSYRPWIIIGTFVFAAVGTPSTDPFSMLFLAIPMLVLFLIAEVIARLVDRARGRGRDSTEQWADDEVSPL